MQKKKDYNYLYYFIQLVLFGLLIMFICTYFAGVKATEVFRESKENIFTCIYCLLFSFLPYILKRWNVRTTKTLEVYFILAIMAHFLLGDMLHYYRDVWFFSFVIHFFNSFMIGTIIYGILLRHCKNQSKFFMFLTTVAFTALIGVLWEVCEYAIDGMAGRNMQRFNDSVTGEPFIGRKALQDTMIDLMMDTVGGLLAGLYFAFTNIKGVPLYKFMELKIVKADNSISYQEDVVDDYQLQQAKADKKALKLEQKNNKRKNKIEQKQVKHTYKQEKSKAKHAEKLTKKGTKSAKKMNSKSKKDNTNIDKLTENNDTNTNEK